MAVFDPDNRIVSDGLLAIVSPNLGISYRHQNRLLASARTNCRGM
jgi:hypothetical protein